MCSTSHAGLSVNYGSSVTYSLKTLGLEHSIKGSTSCILTELNSYNQSKLSEQQVTVSTTSSHLTLSIFPEYGELKSNQSQDEGVWG